MKLKSRISTFLGKDTAFEGNLTFSGAIRIDGQFKGSINSSGTLVVGRDGRVQSDIRVGHIIVSGEVRGDILAEGSIEIQVPGRVFGDIQAPTVMIHQGVVFEGNCRTLPVRKDANPLKLSIIHGRSAGGDGPLAINANTGS